MADESQAKNPLKSNLISKAEIEEFLHYEPDTGEFYWKVNRRKVKAGAMAGTDNGEGYILIRIDGRRYKAHRLAWLLTYGVMPQYMIDHVNGDPSDNRIKNLRVATNAENMRNMRKPPSNTSGFKGVRWYRPDRKFRAEIKHNGKKIHLGSFTTAKAAHAAYCNAAIKYFGEFARFQ